VNDSTWHSRLQNTVGLAAEWVVPALIMLVTVASTLRILGTLF